MHPSLGKTQTLKDDMDPARAEALQVVLGIDGPPLAHDAFLPPFFHHAYFWHVLPEDRLGRDGHPRLGGLIPDLGLPRRMWAGGRLRFLAPIRTCTPAAKITTITRIEQKQGRTGPLAFITLNHEIRQSARACVIEEQDLVYRADPGPGAAAPTPPEAPNDEEEAHQISFSPVTLFRYSALTMNGHRIHYDLDYCRNDEGYPGLVVHGPLLAQHLITMATRALGPLTQFSFRATAPLFQGETASFCRRGDRLWVRGPDGRLCMEATATGSG